MPAADGSQLDLSQLTVADRSRLLNLDGRMRPVRIADYFIDRDLDHLLIVDAFAGLGGATEGIERAVGRPVDVAINHNEAALALHRHLHPRTKHMISCVHEVVPLEATEGRPVGLFWASPDCTFFSNARGAAPIRKKDKRVRGLASVIIRWARDVRPYVIAGENVVEFMQNGPTIAKRDAQGRHMCDAHGNKLYVPDPTRAGQTFKRWVRALERLGYEIQFWELRGCDYGAPTIRRRLFWCAKLAGPIVKPEPTHGPGREHPYRTTAECIDWSIKPRSIFGRERDLAEASLHRIATGVVKFVIANARPFIVTCNHGGEEFRGQSIDEPFATVTAARDAHGIVVPHVTKFRTGSTGFEVSEPGHTITSGAGSRRAAGAAHAMGLVTAQAQRVSSATVVTYYSTGGQDQDIAGPGHTATGKARLSLVTVDAAFVAQHNGGFCETDARPVDGPSSTMTTKGSQQQLVAAHLTHFYSSNSAGGDATLDEPGRVVTAGGQHHGLVEVSLSESDREGARRCAEFLRKYYKPRKSDSPELLARVRDGIVEINGEAYVITDIAMRMFEPIETASIQGFDKSVKLDIECWYRTDKGRLKYGPLPKSHQIAAIGNSVNPQVAEAIVRANYVDDPAHWQALLPMRLAA